MFSDGLPVLVTLPERISAGRVPTLDGLPNAPPLTTNAPAVPVLTPKAVTTPVPVVVVLGAAPAPPPRTKALAANAAEDANVPVAVYARTPPDVPDAKPVPPLATGRIPVVEVTDTGTKSTPFQTTRAAVPATMVTPVVGPTPTIFMLWELLVLLITRYVLDCAGAVMVRVTVPPAVQRMTACREVLLAPVVVVSVTSASELRVVVPATAESTKEVMPLLTVSPHVPDNSPVTGSARPNRDV
jgi:hypothetical protein